MKPESVKGPLRAEGADSLHSHGASGQRHSSRYTNRSLMMTPSLEML